MQIKLAAGTPAETRHVSDSAAALKEAPPVSGSRIPVSAVAASVLSAPDTVAWPRAGAILAATVAITGAFIKHKRTTTYLDAPALEPA